MTFDEMVRLGSQICQDVVPPARPQDPSSNTQSRNGWGRRMLILLLPAARPPGSGTHSIPDLSALIPPFNVAIFMNPFMCVAPDVKLGKDVKLSKFINLYGCEIGDESKIGAFVEIQKNAKRGQALQDFEPYVYLRRRHYRGQRLHRAWSNVHQRQLSSCVRAPEVICKPKATGRSSGPSSEGSINRLGRHDPLQHHNW